MDLTPQKVQKVESIPADELHHYEHHVFRLYEDERKDDMIESIKENGILTPLIVREKGDEYEILAGHNRFECGKAAGLTAFPCIVKNVDDEEAELIVTVTNLHQRSLSDMSHSQKAKAIKTYYLRWTGAHTADAAAFAVLPRYSRLTYLVGTPSLESLA